MPIDEHRFDLLEIIEKRDNNYFLYITQNIEFDLTQLRFEKGFRLKNDGSITSATARAFKINLDKISIDAKEEHYDKNIYATTKQPQNVNDLSYLIHKCERIVKGSLTIPNKNIIVEKNFIKEIKEVLKDKTNDKMSKLHKVKVTSAQISVGIATNSLNSRVNAAHIHENTCSNHKHNTNNVESIIGGTNYSQDDENSWRQSLNDPTTWKIIGYEEVYSLFELLDNELKKKVLDVVGHQILEVDEIPFNIREYEKSKKPYIHKLLITNKMINVSECNILASIVSEENNVFSLHVEYIKNRPVIVIHHIQGEKTKLFSNKVTIKLGWITIGPPIGFDFGIQCPLVLKSGKYQALGDKDYHIINNCGIFSTCALEATNITPQVRSSSDIRTATYRQIPDNPKESPYVIGNYLTSACRESTWLLVYDIKAKKKVTDEEVLKRLALYSW
ncbi:3045_t:CDS:2 [Racocetra fulgida]|uniref:3045_t:CDS:1 n=1 Tax=Racocetra fulgida TaxID=60492 RepID=A0A9N9BC32_9GLOM|nr:3045_t:CDS:2 [Racocetra fulgida]